VSERSLILRGGNHAAFATREAQCLLAGPAGTGKSLAWLAKTFHNADKYPGSRHLICRKTRSSLTETALVSFERDILGPGSPLTVPANLRRVRQAYHHPNGSEIIIAGLDKPEKVLSSEYDTVYCQEATELELEEWETLIGRLRSNRMPYQQIGADCNPTYPHHWLYKRYQAGNLNLLTSTHKDNPRYYAKGEDGAWGWTEEGQRYLDKLKMLTGFRRKRFLDGVWAAAEGLVYEAYGPHNLKERGWTPPQAWPRYLSLDFGYVNPLVCQWWAEDGDGRLYLYREMYRTGYLVEDLAKWVKQEITPNQAGNSAEPRPVAVVADHDAEDRATFERHSGLKVTPADKSKTSGIQNVGKRFEVAGDGKPRLFIVSGACIRPDRTLGDAGKPTSTEEELAGYVWHPDGKDEPVKENDHGCDAMRYLVQHRDGKTKLTFGVR
jgi:phage terminase large subunit